MRILSLKQNSMSARKILMSMVACVGLMMFTVSWVSAQTNVTGVVKSAAGEPLIGASVIEKNATGGTITDLDGRFTLELKNSTSTFSYLSRLQISFFPSGRKE